jgi:hypothetical protein
VLSELLSKRPKLPNNQDIFIFQPARTPTFLACLHTRLRKPHKKGKLSKELA